MVLIGVAFAAAVIAVGAQWLGGDEVTGRTKAHRVSNGLGAISATIVAVLLVGLGWWPLAPAFAMYGLLQAIWIFSPDPPEGLTRRRAMGERRGTEV